MLLFDGIDYYISEDLVSAVTATNKPYIVSLSGKNIDENLEMLENNRVMLNI